MDVFNLRDQLVTDYARYVQSFINISDERIREEVDQKLQDGVLWPDPLIQLNPSFEPGASVPDLAASGVLHGECRKVFAIKDAATGNIIKPLQLYRHQLDAIEAARTGDSYVLTTGTGSGKSLTYVIPIVDYVLRNGTGKGIKAIVVYPMNALANSQEQELNKFINLGYSDSRGPVTFAKYTGQELDDRRREIIASPPDILLTNYVMLELLLTRPYDRRLIDHARGLRFLVFDELHTYRGRQGADVAMLIRRVREACHARSLQCVGTSATLVGEGTRAEQRAAVAEMASRLFGTTVRPDRIIGETLRRATEAIDATDSAQVASIRANVTSEAADVTPVFEDFIRYPLARWIETTIGLTTDDEGKLTRATPLRLRGRDSAAQKLAALIGIDEDKCARAISRCLLTGYNCDRPDNDFPTFAFRVHQFISRGDNVYASLETAEERRITLHGQQFVSGDRSRILLPLAFCRECGQEYYLVERYRSDRTDSWSYRKRELRDTGESDDCIAGFLYRSEESPWPEDQDDDFFRRIPDDWVELGRDDNPRVKSDRRRQLPKPVTVDPLGTESADGLQMQFVPAPFRFCLKCGVVHAGRINDFAKLSTLASGGRSTATTTLCLSAIRWLREDGTLPEHARKVLSFTDNRQDASLQAGHFNDFVEIGMLRSALYHAAVAAGPDGLDHSRVTQSVFDVLNLEFEHYASNPEARYEARRRTESALRDVLGYRLYFDLQRGWRLTSPNLEQCGLLEIQYESLPEIAADEDLWSKFHPALATATPDQRQFVCKAMLDFMRRELAIKVDYLRYEFQERLKRTSSQELIAPWALDENERLWTAPEARIGSKQAGDPRGFHYLSPRGGFGLLLRRATTFSQYTYPAKGKLDDTLAIMNDLAAAMVAGGLIERTSNGALPAFQVQASCMRWVAGEGTKTFHDPIRVPRTSTMGGKTNQFFVDYFKSAGLENRDLQAREHTAAVNNDDREQREADFRSAKLQLLFCSPTMELGVDIAQLNAVNLRNVPPTPANYAQRSGRAGRSGQPALVFTYCTTGSPHDQYFFKRPEHMVYGAVSSPRLDLANEDLIRSHVHAVWLAETGASLENSLSQILQLEGNPPSLELLDRVKHDLDREHARRAAEYRVRSILDPIADVLAESGWWSNDWISQAIDNVMGRFSQACDRWRSLYWAALSQHNIQHRNKQDPSRSAQDKEKANRLYREAESQLNLLTDARSAVHDDFYSYRYFASEGFLPGYSFPRLPLSAFIPGRKIRETDRNEYVSRPRFLAISEFGPRAVIYHEGVRYRVVRVILPASDMDEEGLTTVTAKQCRVCGYLHYTTSGNGNHDLCEYCGSELDAAMTNLFRLRNVSTRRLDRINSDEEERLRQGFELSTGVRFVEHGGVPAYTIASVKRNGDTLAELSYGHSATIWRINRGWRRRKDEHLLGFMLDVERGYWAKNDEDPEDDDDPMSDRRQRVIPFVEDRRNALLLRPQGERSIKFMASLQAALKAAIQTCHQLEDSELAVEALPSDFERRLVLVYEAAEGGAGVLRRLVEDPGALGHVARRALEILHFDPITGKDVSQGEDRCEAACYDCLMSYYNQRDHEHLDRLEIKDFLMQLAGARVECSSGKESRADHYQRLVNLSESELERSFLRCLYDGEFRLPSAAQRLFEQCSTRPDFLYDKQRTAIYVDGPHHKYPDRAARDAAQTTCMEDLGWTVLRISDADWAAVVSQHPNIFGGGK